MRSIGFSLRATRLVGASTTEAYEQIRARAMILVLQCTALRIADVATLRKDAISWDQKKATWRLHLRTLKTGDHVFLPVPPFVKHALDTVPLPRGAAQDCPCYFWNGHTSHRAVVGIAERTLSAVFKESGVKKARAHRFRHTLATRLLGHGVTFERVAEILGNSPAASACECDHRLAARAGMGRRSGI
jgi:integrase